MNVSKERLTTIALSGLLFFSVFLSLSLFLNDKIILACLFTLCTFLFAKELLNNKKVLEQNLNSTVHACISLWFSILISLVFERPSQALLVYCFFPLCLATQLLLGVKKGTALSIIALTICVPLSLESHDISTFYFAVSLIVFLCLLFVLLNYIENLEQSIEYAKTTDPITGCLSIRAFKQHVETSAELCRRYKSQVTCMTFNTTFDINKHQLKDIFLKEVAQICMSRIRQTDVITHYNNGCFLILLSNTSEKSAESLGEDLLRACQVYKFNDSTNQIKHLEFSYALSSYPENTSWDTWFSQLTQD